MRVGIYTHYARCDQTYFSLRLADFLSANNVEFSIYSDSPPAKLRVAYDNVVKHKKKIKYTDCAKDCSAIIWTHVPKIEQINCAKRRGSTTILVPMWQDLVPPFKKVIRQADHLVAMSAECRELFQSIYKFKHTTFIPYDAGFPAIKKDGEFTGRKIRLLLPWFDRNARCTQPEFLQQLQEILLRMPEAQLTVVIASSQFAPAIAKFFQALGRRTNGRVKLLRNVDVNARPALFTSHDLTIFPAECDNFGYTNILSINCGTPVLTFAVSPQIDLIAPKMNGVLVRTKIDYDENGVPHAAPNYAHYAEALQALIAEPKYINAMNKNITHNFAARRRAFEFGWQSLLRIV